jgi:hypothetical protein
MSDAESSSKRAEANRRNAQKSTGPKTADGKNRARFNAVKHGMRAATLILPGEDAGAYQARLDAWTRDLTPADDVERFLVSRAVQLSWQLERADRALADRAVGTDRLDDQADEVAALGRRLLWDPRGPTFFYPQFEITLGDPKRVSWSGLRDDPDDPVRLLNRLESTALGCAWLLDRWDELKDALEAGRNWEPRDRFKAIRLLGRQPLDIDDDGRVLTIYACCTAMDTTGSIALKDLTNELHWNEQKRLADWITRRWAEPEDRPDAETAKAALLALVTDEEQRLEDLLGMLLDRDQTSRPTLEFDDSDSAERLRRYQATCDRSLLRILEALRKRRRDAAGRTVQGESGSPRRPNDVAEPPAGTARLLSLLQAIGDRKIQDRPNIQLAQATAGNPPASAGEPTPSPLIPSERQPTAPVSPTPTPSSPVAAPSDEEPPSESAIEPASLVTATSSAPHHNGATNEPNEAGHRRAPTSPVALLGLFVALISAGFGVSFAASLEHHDRVPTSPTLRQTDRTPEIIGATGSPVRDHQSTTSAAVSSRPRGQAMLIYVKGAPRGRSRLGSSSICPTP